MKVYGYVYLVRNKINGKVYIGQTIRPLNKRWTEHKAAGKKSRKYLYNAIKKYGKDNFTLLELGRASSKAELDEMEIRAIWTHESDNEAYGYNLTKGGDGTIGFRHSEETKKRLRDQRLGKKTGPRSFEFCQAISKRLTGHIVSDETRCKLSKTHTGRIAGSPSDETRRKLSEAKKGKCSDALRESCRRQAIAMKGKPGKKRTEEQKENYRKAAKERWTKYYAEKQSAMTTQ